MRKLVRIIVLTVILFSAGCGFAIVDEEKNQVKTFGLDKEDVSCILGQGSDSR